MRKAEKSDKDRVIKIICESFDSNPHVNLIIKNDKRRPSRMAAMAEYAFEVGMRRNGVHLTDDAQGVTIIFDFHKIKMNLYEYYLQFKLIFKSFTLPRVLMVNKVENLIKKNRASNVKFLYLWFFGVANEALGSSDGRDLMKFIFQLSADQKLPIYLETSLKRNNIIYKRYGFEDYNMLETGYDNLTMWYMKRPHEHRL